MNGHQRHLAVQVRDALIIQLRNLEALKPKVERMLGDIPTTDPRRAELLDLRDVLHNTTEGIRLDWQKLVQALEVQEIRGEEPEERLTPRPGGPAVIDRSLGCTDRSLGYAAGQWPTTPRPGPLKDQITVDPRPRFEDQGAAARDAARKRGSG